MNVEHHAQDLKQLNETHVMNLFQYQTSFSLSRSRVAHEWQCIRHFRRFTTSATSIGMEYTRTHTLR